MANIKSASKRIEIAKRNNLRNKAYKSTVKTLLKKTFISINTPSSSSDLGMIKDLISLTCSKIDKAVQKKILHSNSANSKKSALAKAFKKYELVLSSRL